jgi:type II secretory pathway pseudopilin PulG
MVEGIAAAGAVESLLVTQAAATQPTAQQAARFENQLQQLHYDAPLTEPTGFAADFRALTDFAGHLSTDFRTKLAHEDAKIDAERWPELAMLQDFSREMRGLNLTTVQFQFVAAGVEITNRNAQTLFQQA